MASSGEWSGALPISSGSLDRTGSFSWVNVSVVFSGLERARSFYSSATHGFGSAVVGAFGSPAVDVRLVPTPYMEEEA